MSKTFIYQADAGYYGTHGLLDIESLDLNPLVNAIPSYFSTSLTRPIMDIRKVSLSQAVIPFTFYTVNATGFDNIPFQEGANPTIFIALPASSPTFAEFATTVASLLTSNSPGGSTYTVTYSDQTGKYTITNSLNLNFTFDWTASLNQIIATRQFNAGYQFLGANNYIYNYTAAQATTYVSPGVALLNPGVIYISIEPINSNVTALTKTNRTFIVPVNANFGGIITYLRNAGDDQSLYYGNKGFNLNKFEVKITNSFGQILPIAGYVKIALQYETWPENELA